MTPTKTMLQTHYIRFELRLLALAAATGMGCARSATNSMLDAAAAGRESGTDTADSAVEPDASGVTTLVLAPSDNREFSGAVDSGDPLWNAPFLHEVPRECPLPEGIVPVPMAHDTFVIQAGADLMLEAVLTHVAPDAVHSDTGLIAYAGPTLPTNLAGCISVDTASGGFPGTVEFALESGATATITVFAFPSQPREYALELTAH